MPRLWSSVHQTDGPSPSVLVASKFSFSPSGKDTLVPTPARPMPPSIGRYSLGSGMGPLIRLTSAAAAATATHAKPELPPSPHDTTLTYGLRSVRSARSSPICRLGRSPLFEGTAADKQAVRVGSFFLSAHQHTHPWAGIAATVPPRGGSRGGAPPTGSPLVQRKGGLAFTWCSPALKWAKYLTEIAPPTPPVPFPPTPLKPPPPASPPIRSSTPTSTPTPPHSTYVIL